MIDPQEGELYEALEKAISRMEFDPLPEERDIRIWAYGGWWTPEDFYQAYESWPSIYMGGPVEYHQNMDDHRSPPDRVAWVTLIPPSDQPTPESMPPQTPDRDPSGMDDQGPKPPRGPAHGEG